MLPLLMVPPLLVPPPPPLFCSELRPAVGDAVSRFPSLCDGDGELIRDTVLISDNLNHFGKRNEIHVGFLISS